jgi:hypothetical protein
MSLSAEAEKRKERLLALKKRKREQADDTERPSEEPKLPSNHSSTAETDSKSYFLNLPPSSNFHVVSLYQAETTMLQLVQQS